MTPELFVMDVPVGDVTYVVSLTDPDAPWDRSWEVHHPDGFAVGVVSMMPSTKGLGLTRLVVRVEREEGLTVVSDAVINEPRSESTLGRELAASVRLLGAVFALVGAPESAARARQAEGIESLAKKTADSMPGAGGRPMEPGAVLDLFLKATGVSHTRATRGGMVEGLNQGTMSRLVRGGYDGVLTTTLFNYATAAGAPPIIVFALEALRLQDLQDLRNSR